MRNRRLLTLAVLAVAIGFPAYAQAVDPYGIAVVTLIQDPNVGGVIQDHFFEIRVRLWDDAGIGEEVVSTAGLADFSLKDIKAAVGDLEVTGMDVFGVAPSGAVTQDGNTYGAGFTQFNGTTNLGIADAVENPVGIFNASGLQPVMYSKFPGTNVPLRDAGVLLGVGTVGSAGAPALPSGITWDGNAPVYDPDTRIATGEYTGDNGLLDANTFGAISFTVLPNVAGTRFTTGPMDPTVFKAMTVRAVVVQTITGEAATSNNGGVELLADGNSLLAKVRMRVEIGEVTLGGSFVGGANVTLQVSEPNTSVIMAADQTFGGADTLDAKGGLDIRPLNDGKQVVDIGTALVAVYSPDPAQTHINIKGDESTPSMLGDANDGLYSSAIDPGNPAHILVVTVGPDADCVLIKATIIGDTDLSGFVNFTDYTLQSDNWLAPGGWSQGDFDDSGYVNFTDYTMQADNWLTGFVPFVPAPPVPEPATMALLCLGALGLLRRRRGS